MSISVGSYIAAEVKGEAIVLSTKNQWYQMKLLGGTITTNASPKPSGCHSMVLYPEKGRGGIIALAIVNYDRDHKGHTIVALRFSVFLEVTWENDIPRIELQNHWNPVQRVGGFCGSSQDGLLVKIGVNIFTTETIYDHAYKNGEKKPYAVSNTNLLCSYLYGEATAEQVIASAVEPKLEENARKQLPKFVARVNELENKSRELERTCNGVIALYNERVKRDNQIRSAVTASGPIYNLLAKLPEKVRPGFVKTFLREYQLATKSMA